MFVISDTGDGLVAKETPHYSKMEADIDVQLSQGIPVVLVMDIAQVESLGIDPASVTTEGAAPQQTAPPPAK